MYVVFLQQTASADILEVVANYLQSRKTLRYLFCRQVEQAGYFLACELVKNDKDTSPWKLQIPLGYVLSIADMRGDQHPLGFLNP